MSAKAESSRTPFIAMTPLPVLDTARNSASISFRSAQRLGAALPSAPRWVIAKLVANPAAPACIASTMRFDIRRTSSSIATQLDASPLITWMRRAV